MKLGCIVLAHREPDQLAMLISALRHPDVRIYLHLDRRVSLAPFMRALSRVGAANVALLPRRATPWGGTGLVDAALDGLEHGIRDRCAYFTLISGQDFPLRPAGAMVAFAENAGSRSYVEHWELPSARWRLGGRDRTDFYSYDLLGRRETCIPRGEDVSHLSWKGRMVNSLLRGRSVLKPLRRFPAYARPFGGHQWWNMSEEAAEHTLRYVADHPDYQRYHRHTLAPDELFFHSILLGTGFADRYEVVNDSLRYMRWPDNESHPRVLTEADLPGLLASEALFARKFDPVIDNRVLTRLADSVLV
jgi:hypothetical protein